MSSCADGGGADTYTSLRIGSIFIILATAACGTFFPILARRTSWLRIPTAAFEFIKYFGSGVIVATGFIHLLSPASQELSSPCLSAAWQAYPYAFGLAMLSLYCIFLVEVIAFRIGSAKLAKAGIDAEHLEHADMSHVLEGSTVEEKSISDVEEAKNMEHLDHNALAQVAGVFILEFGVVLHSLLIGMTLAVDPSFITLFLVIIFHQTFEGLGVGTRLAFMKLSPKYRWIPFVMAALYAVTTPVGIAVGLGIRNTYNPGSTTASIVSGVMDSLSAGVLLYTGMVELMAHEFLFNPEMNKASTGKLVYALCCMLAGSAIMALLGRWA